MRLIEKLAKNSLLIENDIECELLFKEIHREEMNNCHDLVY